MDEGGEQTFDTMSEDEYRTLETRLYGEILKSCRRYSHQLNMISILGILEMVKYEMKDLEKTNLRFMKEDVPEKIEQPFQEEDIDPLDRPL